MNREIRNILKERNIHPISYQKIRKVYIIKDKNHGYVIKLKTNNYDIYKYLISRDFTNFPDTFTYENDNYDIYEYIPDIKEEKEQKIEDLIVLISLLHKKTSYIRIISLDDIKEIYENIIKKINDTRNYFIKLNDNIDKDLFLSPHDYLLIKNISLIYYSLEQSHNYINDWYNMIKNNKSMRVALLHNNISIDHLIVNDEKYLISWDKSYFDNPIYDIESFYRKYYQEIELNDTIKLYEINNKLNSLEYKLLLVLLLIPRKFEFTSNNLSNTILVNNEIIYLKKVIEVIKKDKKIELSKN